VTTSVYTAASAGLIRYPLIGFVTVNPKYWAGQNELLLLLPDGEFSRRVTKLCED
jgi:hypothetical protein